MLISIWKVKLCKLALSVTAPCSRNFSCTKVRAKPFYVHENQCIQILNLSSLAGYHKCHVFCNLGL